MTDQPCTASEADAAPRPPTHEPGRRWARFAALPGLAATAAFLWLVGLVLFANAIPSKVANPDTPTDAIVVLTGGSLRLEHGLDLLVAGKAKKLFVSGVHQGVATADLLRISHHVPSWVTCCIVLGHVADSTIGNAIETAAWMRREGYHSLRLVTANYHMRRSLFEFTRAMPGVKIIPHPVFPARVKQNDWWAWPGTASLIVGEYDKYIGAVLRALVEGPIAGLEPPPEPRKEQHAPR